MKSKLIQMILKQVTLFFFLFVGSFVNLFAQSVSITSSATSNIVCAGTTVTFTAIPSGLNSPTYQWYKNNAVITGATSSTYSTTSLINNDQINISVNGLGNIVSNGLLLNLDANNPSSYAGSGNTWYDLSGNNNHATLNNNPTYDATSGSIVTNGTNQYISIPQISTSNTNVTMQAWVYVNPSTTGTFMKNGNGYSIGIGQNAYDQVGSNVVMLVYGVGWKATGVSYGSAGWKLITMTLDGSSVPSAYVNGAFIGRYSNSSGTPVVPAGPLYIGASIGDQGFYYNGKFGAVYFYNRALSQAEITQNFNSLSNSITSNTITVTLTANNTVSAASSTPTLCINTALSNITHTTTGATGIGTATGLPAGVTAAFASNTITISGTPTVAGSFNYSIPLTGGCSVNATGTITVNALPALELTRQNSSTNGLNFVGSPFIKINNNNNALKINVGSVEAWIKTPNAGSGFRGIVAKQEAYSLFLNDNILIIYDWSSGGGVKSTGVNLGDNLWHHVAVSFNSGVDNGTFVYIDGVLKLTTKYTVNNQNMVLAIGAGDGNGSQPFTGNIDDVRIWNTARTQSQIQAVMNSELLGTELGLVAYYNFNQGTAGGTNTGISTLKDLTSNANDGTLNGFALTGAVSNWVDGASNGATGSVMVNSTIQLNNATLGGVWSTSDASLATVSSSGLVTGKNAGTVIINYTFSNSNNCSATVATSITVNSLNTSSAASSTPSLCINTALNSITFTTSGATGIATATGLPAGVTAAFASNTIAISGTPTVIGTFNYSIPLTGGFGTVNATGTITVNPTLTVNVTVSGDACINKTILTATAGLTSYAWYKDNVLISGATSNSYTPTTAGAYQVQVSNGSCTSTSSSTTIYTCGLTADGRMVPTTNSTTLVSVEGATNNGKGIDERGLIVSKPFSAPSIITSGLVMSLDAADLASYSGTGTTWTDLSGNGSSGTLVNGPTYNASNQGYFSFDGNDDYISLPRSNLSNFGSGDFGLEMWVYVENANTNPHIITINGNGSWYAALRMSYYSGNLYTNHSSNGTGWESAGANFAFATGAWSQIVISRISGIVKVYVNSVEKSSYSLTNPLMINADTQLGKLSNFTSNYHTMKGNIAITRIYQNKGLTPSEVTTNFNAVRSRFGL